MTLDGLVPLDQAERASRRQKANGYDKSAGRIQPMLIRNARDITAALDTPYTIKEAVLPGQISFWYGPSSSCKTFLLQHVLWKVALGQSTLNRRVRGGPVLYYSLEPGSIDNRLLAARQAYGDTDNFHFCEDPIDLFASDAAAMQIAEAAKEHRAVVVAIDPLGVSMPGANENDFTDVSVVVKRLRWIAREAGTHVACVAHTGKDTERGQRGSSHFFASGDFVASVSEGVGDERVIELMKVRDGRKGQQFTFTVRELELGTDSDGDRVVTLVADAHDEPTRRQAPAVKVSKGDLQALGWLREAIDEYGEMPPLDLPAGIRATTKDKWAAIAKKRTGDDDKSDAIRKAIGRAITNLTVAKLIGVNAPYFWVIR